MKLSEMDITDIMTIITLVAALIMIALAFVLGLTMGKDMAVPVVEVVDSEILSAVFECHGDICICQDENGVLYFERDGKHCLVFGVGFKIWYAKEKL